MKITKTIKVTMSEEEKAAFDIVMNSLETLCTEMRSIELDETENFLFDCAAKALSYLDDVRVSI